MPKTNGKYIWLFAALFIPYIILCFYAWPTADDYTYSLWDLRGGYWHYQLHDFFYWNGRYASNPLVMLNPIKVGSLVGYRLVAFFLILLTPLCFYFFISSLFKNVLGFSQKVIASLLFSVLYFGLMPDLPEGIYWMTGSITYHLGDLLALVYAGLIIRYLQQRFFVNPIVHISLSVLLLFFTIGFNEVLTLILILAHIIAFISFQKDKRLRSILLGLSIVTVLFSLLMILAPGNTQRGAYFTNNYRILHSLYMTSLQIVRFFLKWVSFPPLLIGSILFIPIAQRLEKESELFRKLTSLKYWQAFILLLLVIFCCVFPAYWGTGILGQHRTLNTACFFFIPLWLLFIYSAARHFKLADRLIYINTKFQPLFIILFAAGLLLSGNSGRAIIELGSGEIKNFATEMEARTAKLEQAKQQGQKEIALPLIQSKPTSLFVLDISNSYKADANTAYAVFYNIDKVYADSLPKP